MESFLLILIDRGVRYHPILAKEVLSPKEKGLVMENDRILYCVAPYARSRSLPVLCSAIIDLFFLPKELNYPRFGTLRPCLLSAGTEESVD